MTPKVIHLALASHICYICNGVICTHLLRVIDFGLLADGHIIGDPCGGGVGVLLS